MNACLIDDCSNPSRSRGWCKKHYARWRRNGDPKGGKSYGAPTAALKAVVAQPPDGCVTWPFSTNNGGYGQLRFRGRTTSAHRAALILYSGPPPTREHEAAHDPELCNDRACFNPLHIRWATRSENQADRLIAGTDGRGERAPRARLTEQDVRAIRNDARSITELAKLYDVCRNTIYNVQTRNTWWYVS